MTLEVHEQQGFSLITLSGEIDLSCAPEVRSKILASLAARRPTLVALEGVSYIDSSGVAALVEGYQTARRKHLEFGLLAPSDAVRSVLQLAHLDKVFQIHDSLGARLNAPPPAVS